MSEAWENLPEYYRPVSRSPETIQPTDQDKRDCMVRGINWLLSDKSDILKEELAGVLYDALQAGIQSAADVESLLAANKRLAQVARSALDGWACSTKEYITTLPHKFLIKDHPGEVLFDMPLEPRVDLGWYKPAEYNRSKKKKADVRLNLDRCKDGTFSFGRHTETGEGRRCEWTTYIATGEGVLKEVSWRARDCDGLTTGGFTEFCHLTELAGDNGYPIWRLQDETYRDHTAESMGY